jgi:hypothetical protein
MYVLHHNSPYLSGEIQPESDETLPTIENKKPKHPKKKRGIQGMKWNDPHPRRQMNHPMWEGQTTRGTSSSGTPFSCEKHYQLKKGEDLLKGHLA